MKQIALFVVLIINIAFFSCEKKETNPEKIIAGESSKIWKAKKETNAAGKKEKLSDVEKDEILQFYANKTFSVNGSSETAQGTWKYEEDSKNLSLQFADANVTENFNVLSLDKEEIKLQAADGSTMLLSSN